MQQELNELLTKAKELLKEEVSSISFDTWIKPLEIESMESGNILLITETKFQKELLDSKYHELLVNTFKFLTNKECSITIVSSDEKKDNNNSTINNNITINYFNNSIKPEYTFENFVVGKNNEFAHAAALAVAEAPATAYNPLFLYSGSGLGKTHLMHAIGNEILKNNKNANVLYVTSEDFTNQLVNSLKDNTMEQFRNKYRNIDVLLIDDIQFIANKDRTQEEFFHTFETLHNNGKQIIISSDRPPKEINLSEERLRGRFAWGVMADISNADYETRFAILKKKAQQENILIDDEILSNIAIKIDTNIRELEGALNKLIARASLINSPITMEMSEWAINEIISSKDKIISAEYIQETVSKYFNVDVKDLVGQKRSADIVFPRQIAMYLCRSIPQISLPQIGKDFGGRDHTTVLHACNKIEKEIKDNKNTKMIVDSVKNIILADK